MADLSNEHLSHLEHPDRLPPQVLQCLGHAAAQFAFCELRHGKNCKETFFEAVRACLTIQGR